MGVQPLQQSAVAVRGGGKRRGGQVPAYGVDHCGLVEVGVGVHTADHCGLFCHAGAAVLPCEREGSHGPVGRQDKTVMGPLAGLLTC